MTKNIFLTAGSAGLIVAAALMAALTGCVTEGTGRATVYRPRPVVQAQTVVSFQDDYDYYPGYEVYYSRNRREYVYLEGRTWVRRSQPLGVSVDALFSAPSVRLDFRDSPERHHHDVVRSYPRNWVRPGNHHIEEDDRRDDNRHHRKSEKDRDKKHEKRDRKNDHRRD